MSRASASPTHVRLRGAACGLFRDSTVLLEQLRTLDKSRLGEYMGSVGGDKMREVAAALNISVGLKESLKSAIIHSGDIPMDISADFILPNQRRTPPMTTKELTDNAAFLSAMQMLEQKLLSPAEAEKTRSELKRRLRPTLIFA